MLAATLRARAHARRLQLYRQLGQDTLVLLDDRMNGIVTGLAVSQSGVVHTVGLFTRASDLSHIPSPSNRSIEYLSRL
jgi:hypothetical protein